MMNGNLTNLYLYTDLYIGSGTFNDNVGVSLPLNIPTNFMISTLSVIIYSTVITADKRTQFFTNYKITSELPLYYAIANTINSYDIIRVSAYDGKFKILEEKNGLQIYVNSIRAYGYYHTN